MAQYRRQYRCAHDGLRCPQCYACYTMQTLNDTAPPWSSVACEAALGHAVLAALQPSPEHGRVEYAGASGTVVAEACTAAFAAVMTAGRTKRHPTRREAAGAATAAGHAARATYLAELEAAPAPPLRNYTVLPAARSAALRAAARAQQAYAASLPPQRSAAQAAAEDVVFDAEVERQATARHEARVRGVRAYYAEQKWKERLHALQAWSPALAAAARWCDGAYRVLCCVAARGRAR